MEEYRIHGGVVTGIDTQGGDVYIYGGLINELNLGGGRVVLRGGIIQNLCDGKTKIETKVEEKIVEKKVVKYVVRDTPATIELLEKLKSENSDLKTENEKLQRKISVIKRSELLNDNLAMAAAMKRAKNRERILIAQRDEALAKLAASPTVWDDYQPTKQEIKNLYRTMCAMTEIVE